jgi:hypothetical protein
MINKGLDTTFIHYGIRKEDMETIKNMCDEQQLDFEWVKENILKEYHSLKINNDDIEGKKIEKIIEKALNKI